MKTEQGENMGMQTERSESIGKLAEALAKAQGQFESVEKDEEAKAGKINYKYAELESYIRATRRGLSENGIAIIQTPLNKEGQADRITVETLLVHSSGEWIKGLLALPIVPGYMKNPLQDLGSAISYGRRYMFTAMVGIAAKRDDDDGQAGGVTPPADQTMSPEKLLSRLNQEPKVKGFYSDVSSIFHSLDQVTKWPAPEDMDSWNHVLSLARTHALIKSDLKTWSPNFGKFYNHMEPLLPGLLEDAKDDNARYAVVSNLCKTYAKVEEWDPSRAESLREYLLDLENKVSSAEPSADEALPRGNEALRWLVARVKEMGIEMDLSGYEDPFTSEDEAGEAYLRLADELKEEGIQISNLPTLAGEHGGPE